MFERVPKLRAVLDDPKNSHHRKFIERTIEHQRPMVIAIRDGFPEPLRREVGEHEVKKQGKMWSEHIYTNISESASARFSYARFKLGLPDKPSMDMIEFAIALGEAVDALGMGDFRAASFPEDFLGIGFLNQYSLTKRSNRSMRFLTDSAQRLRTEFFLLENLRTLRETSDESAKQWVEKQGIDISSLTPSADGTFSFSQNGCKRTLEIGSKTKTVLTKLYRLCLNPIAYRITFAFSPEI